QKLHGDPRASRPSWIGRIAAIATEIAGISGFSHSGGLETARIRASSISRGICADRYVLNRNRQKKSIKLRIAPLVTGQLPFHSVSCRWFLRADSRVLPVAGRPFS